MFERAIALVLVGCLSATSVYAGDLKGSISAAVRDSVSTQATQQTRMSPTFKWAGIALMVTGGLWAVAPCRFLAGIDNCEILDNAESTGRIVGLSVAGAGVAIFLIGTKRRVPVNDSLSFGARGRNNWFVQKRVRF